MHGQTHYFHPTPLVPRLIRWCYSLLFVAVFLAGAYYALVYAPSVRESASPVLTATHVVPLHDAGQTVYITERQHIMVNAFGAAFAMSLLVWLMVGILLEVKLKVRIFRGSPAPLPRETGHGSPTSFSAN